MPRPGILAPAFRLSFGAHERLETSLGMPVFKNALARLGAWAQSPLPPHALSRLLGVLTRRRHPWVRRPLIRWFLRRYGVDLEEAAEPDPEGYPDFQAFFTRPLKPGARPLCPEPDSIASPADGTVSELGHLAEERSVRAKDAAFGVPELLGGSEDLAAPFTGGSFLTVYLAPRDYHRVHMPRDGTLREMVHIPGRAFSVNPATTAHVPNLFARNERVVARFDTDAGPMAVVLVGAMLVATIGTVWAGTVTPPTRREIRRWHYPEDGEEAIRLAKGEELGWFNLGSTVIVLFGPTRARWREDLTPGQRVLTGSCLGWHPPGETQG
ncbi:phosphatidylserine decarboxylase [Thiohalorhabdus denitrificans]|uniref:Phosphatidylserine decarboxylase proenzyme n=2 Tax=Thiohalorhabdus denitrificans TaxID=381306 RepID=A0A1G5AWM9_9GAMM|nr:phosphatidylserine decarboxylase [Thiohalorhabdus denitrificans]